MTKVTRTTGPLHFEDLEPKRFEDLVRQLAYDFRNWNTLEATGKSGADEGFDIRGREIIQPDEPAEEDEPTNQPLTERIWLFQCKREKYIYPKKLQQYIENILKKHKTGLHGLVFVASCHFSKKARDTFYKTIKDSEIQEAFLWDRSTLEDMLFQPKNDPLLFAYFGISIAFRRRTLKTDIRKKLVPKRKIIRCLGDVTQNFHQKVLIRDAADIHYPYMGGYNDFKKFPRWKQFSALKHTHDGILLLIKKYYAYIGDDGKKWDYIEKLNKATPHNDPWGNDSDKKQRDFDQRVLQYWSDIPETNRAWLQVTVNLPYDKIIEVDEKGDPILSTYQHIPHLYVEFDTKDFPFTYGQIEIKTIGSLYKTITDPKKKDRTKFFPDNFPKIKHNS